MTSGMVMGLGDVEGSLSRVSGYGSRLLENEFGEAVHLIFGAFLRFFKDRLGNYFYLVIGSSCHFSSCHMGYFHFI